MTTSQCEYTLSETVAALRGWVERKRPFFPIDTAISAQHWLLLHQAKLRADDFAPMPLSKTLAEIRAWLSNTDPNIPTWLCEAMLHWLLLAKEVA